MFPVAPDLSWSVGRLLAATAAALLLLMGVAAAIGYVFRDPLLRISHTFVSRFGGFGVALGYFFPDAFSIPLPNDLVSSLGIIGGLSYWECVAWGTGGSLLGGATGYIIGTRIGSSRLIRRVFERQPRVQKLLQVHGLTAVGVAAVTPLPYSIFCWAAGAARLPFWRFAAVSLLRFVRVAGYLYLIQFVLPSQAWSTARSVNHESLRDSVDGREPITYHSNIEASGASTPRRSRWVAWRGRFFPDTVLQARYVRCFR